MKEALFVLFSVSVGKGLYFGFNWHEVVLSGILGSLFVICEYHSQNAKLKKLSDSLNTTQKDLTQLRSDLESTKTHIQGLKLAQQMRPTIAQR